MFVETKVPANVHTTVAPFFVSLPMTDNEGDDWFYDVDVYPKNQTNIPDLDKLDKGLTYNKDATIYFYNNEADARANNTANAIKTWGHGSTAFEETYMGSNSDYNQMTVSPTREGLKEIDPSLSQCWLVVSYSATVNSDATPVLGDAGNTNDVTLRCHVSGTADGYL